MKKILISGSSGYLGVLLCKYFVKRNIPIIGIDLNFSSEFPKEYQIVHDLNNYSGLRKKLDGQEIDSIIHLASQIDFNSTSQKKLFENNIVSTKNLIKLGKNFNINNFIFTSSNSIFLGNNASFINNNDKPVPIDEYGKSKVVSEKLLSSQKHFNYHVLRCPNIIDSGRVGMLAILFELLQCNATLWLLKKGKIRHQCIYAGDLIDAITKLLNIRNKSYIFNIGSSDVKDFKKIFLYLVSKTNSNSKIRFLPSFPIIWILKFLYKIRLSPLGPYQFRMLTRDFIFDTTEITKKLNWMPTKNNEEMLHLAYTYYLNSKKIIKTKTGANSKPVKFGLLSILKFFKF